MNLEFELVNLDEVSEKLEELGMVFGVGGCKCGSGGALCGTCGGGGEIAPPQESEPVYSL